MKENRKIRTALKTLKRSERPASTSKDPRTFA